MFTAPAIHDYRVPSAGVRRIVGAGVGSAVALIVAASPALGANELITTNMTCQYTSTLSRTMTAGDTLTFRLSQTGAFTTYHCEQGLFASTASGSLASPSTTITSLSDGPISITSWPTDVVFTAGSSDTSFQFRQSGQGTITVTITAAAPPDVPSPSVESGPPDVVQQVVMPSRGMCVDIDTESFGQFADVPDGWGPSWASWVDDGSGGAVCTRTFHYSPHTATWDLAV